MANGHGGRRPGAGRRQGQVSQAKRDIAERAREHGDAALNVLIKIAKDDQQPAAARVGAANAILDRGYGKPMQAVEMTGANGGPILSQTIDASKLSTQALAELLAARNAGPVE
jgi:hypothetical protein